MYVEFAPRHVPEMVPDQAVIKEMAHPRSHARVVARIDIHGRLDILVLTILNRQLTWMCESQWLTALFGLISVVLKILLIEQILDDRMQLVCFRNWTVCFPELECLFGIPFRNKIRPVQHELRPHKAMVLAGYPAEFHWLQM